MDPNYISHGEIECGRAESTQRWAPDLAAKMTSEFHEALSRKEIANERVAVAFEADTLAGVAIVRIENHGTVLGAILDDLVIRRDLQGRGIGGEFLTWIVGEVRDAGACHVLLEHGTQNSEARLFFERRGFQPVSETRLRQLDAVD